MPVSQAPLLEPAKRLRCGRCKQVKGYTKFSADPNRPTGRFPWCMDCQNGYAKAHRFQDETAPLTGKYCPLDDVPLRGKANRQFCSSRCKERVAHLRRKFNLTVAEYRALIDATGGLCPICRKRPTEWHVDHDHETGLVTGVVCSACNVGALAMTYHDIAFVRRLMGYLKNTPAMQLGITAVVSEEFAKQSASPQLHKRWQFANQQRKAA